MRIGVAQIRSLDTVEENAANILRFVDEAHRLGVRILGFPETALSGYLFDGFSRVDPARLGAALDQIAARLRDGPPGGRAGHAHEGGRQLHNSAVVLLPDGSRRVYHKMNLVSYERAWFAPGDAPLTFEVEGTQIRGGGLPGPERPRAGAWPGAHRRPRAVPLQRALLRARGSAHEAGEERRAPGRARLRERDLRVQSERGGDQPRHGELRDRA